LSAITTAPATGKALPPAATNVPPFNSVNPPYVFVPLNVSTPEPNFRNPPDPLTPPAYVKSFERLNTNSPLFTTSDTIDPVTPPDPTDTVPAPTVTPPVNVFAPVSVNTPPLVFTNDPVNDDPSAITPPNTPLLNVNAVPSSVTTPSAEPFKVNNSTANGARFTAPFAVITAPEGTVADNPKSNVAPLATVNAVEASEPAATVNLPPFTVVDPVNVFTPLNVRSPVPTFTNEPAATPSPITPAYVPPPIVNTVESNVKTPEPPPFNPATVIEEPKRFSAPSSPTTVPPANIPPASTVITAPVPTPTVSVAKEPDPDTVNVPPDTLNAPVNVFAPPSVIPAAPAFVNAALPEITPFIATALVTVAVVAPDNTAFPDIVNAPVFVASPKTNEPLKSIALARVRAVVLSLEIRPPLKTSVPVPSAALLPT
jgi:hypothetical protein